MNKLSLKNVNFSNKRVLCRVDYNVPLDQGLVTDPKRIIASLPTVNHILENGGKLILMSHLGRPKGQKNPSYSLKPVYEELQKHTKAKVIFSEECIGQEAKEKSENLESGQILLLENLRFHPEEEQNEENFARELASLGDLYVNDAFGSAHRAHASTEGVTKHFSKCVCGFLMEKELSFLGSAVQEPKRPFLAIMGGAKVKDKIPVLENLLPKIDHIIIGGGMAYTFLKAKGIEIGDSLLDESNLDFSKEILNTYPEKILLPTDVLITTKLDFDNKALGDTKTVGVDEIPENWQGVDIGPKSIQHFGETIHASKTILWNGPMGVFEIDESAKGTLGIAQQIAESTQQGSLSIIGGGDSAAAVKKANLVNQMSHVSTGGGASLEFLEGKSLPGVAALTDA